MLGSCNCSFKSKDGLFFLGRLFLFFLFLLPFSFSFFCFLSIFKTVNKFSDIIKTNTMYKELAEQHYVNHKDYKKALAAGIAMDNALKKDYTTGGSTNTHFMMSNFLKYFSYERLPENK